MFVQPMSPYIRLFYIWVFPKAKYGYINSIRVWYYEREGHLIEKRKEDQGCFSSHCSRAQG